MSEKETEKRKHSPWRIQLNNYLAGLCGGLISATTGYPLDVARSSPRPHPRFSFWNIDGINTVLFLSFISVWINSSNNKIIVCGAIPFLDHVSFLHYSQFFLKEYLNSFPYIRGSSVYPDIYFIPEYSPHLVSGQPFMFMLRVRLLFGTSPTSNIGNGFGFTFVYNILKSGLVWPVQKNMQSYVEKQHFEGIQAALLSGAIGNVIPGIILNPFNVIKVRFMESGEAKTTMGIIRGIIAGEGARTFMRGIEATILRDLLWGMIYFPIFESLKSQWDPETARNAANSITLRTLLFQISTSAAAAAFATLMTSVIDGVRLFQMKSMTQGQRHTFLQALRLALVPSSRNFLATFTGVGRVTITTVIGHVTYLQASRILDEL